MKALERFLWFCNDVFVGGLFYGILQILLYDFCFLANCDILPSYKIIQFPIFRNHIVWTDMKQIVGFLNI